MNPQIKTGMQFNFQLPSLSSELLVINVNAKLPSQRTNDNGIDKPHNKTGKIV